MARTRFILVAVLAVTAAFGAPACGDRPDAKPAQASAPTAAPEEQPGTRIGVWRQPAGLVQSPIWPGVAPDMADWDRPPESVLTRHTPEAVGGTISQAVLDVSVPTMTIFPPKGHNAGAAVVVFPGGGFRALALTIEGTEICSWITAKGMTCILSKYRVPGTNHYWNPDCRCSITPDVPRALQDAQRTIRLVRAHAVELGVQPDKIGVMGFSAGGYLVAQTSNIFEPTYTTIDAIDRVSSRPDFAIAFFPGHICRRGRVYEPGFEVSRRAPPTFLLQAWDDDVDDICNSTYYARALDDAGVPAEVHLFASGGHAFGLRRNHSPDTVWPGLLENWLKGIGVL
jgi:acetyl esterase/lipase